MVDGIFDRVGDTVGFLIMSHEAHDLLGDTVKGVQVDPAIGLHALAAEPEGHMDGVVARQLTEHRGQNRDGQFDVMLPPAVLADQDRHLPHVSHVPGHLLGLDVRHAADLHQQLIGKTPVCLG